ncbi:hypothetical protein TPHA_0B04770 [Tetrapisispora phaffii CBS 4417]|uniref:Nitroreductase domain-containing protein n=1 Tax=Tetrapisispora phaffii (strain ATCC 24235 / CBS 4417 / NBRC 1672 / NRRL Y-8282 / UCD 70-5) TaxID=1071381 RepID=G8BQ65_TETPH|nr:hypothetical protein TPHA_0B04770 [Tetrapisispora phaffii CBS 4417]CCE62146.1 hypothetical protein TPHA_0B04770 [Tetrapisispora phaffii CBS 4417]
MSAASFIQSIASRRTIYKLSPELPNGVTIDKVQNFVETLVREIPTALNSQSTRAVILTGNSHKLAWDNVVKAMPSASAKMRPESARDEAFGTIVFMTDVKTIEKLQEEYSAIAHVFPTHSDTSNGAAQITAWAALEQLGLGCHLQHYNPMIKEALQFDIPQEWNVVAQLVFGSVREAPTEKTYINNPVKIYA